MCVRSGNAPGFPWINDASALHTADLGIPVESAVDVAKEAADAWTRCSVVDTTAAR